MRDTDYRKLHKLLLKRIVDENGKKKFNPSVCYRRICGLFSSISLVVFFSSFECSLYKCVVIWGAWTCGTVFQYYKRRRRWWNSHRVCKWFALCLRIETREKKWWKNENEQKKRIHRRCRRRRSIILCIFDFYRSK